MRKLLFLSFCLFILKGNSQNVLNNFAEKADSLGLIRNFDFGGQWFLGNTYNENEDINQFTLKRGYITLKQKFNDMFSVRFTQDITLDREGSDAGNIEVRLKYCFLKMKLNDFTIFNNSFFEFGLVHRPWLDFEQKINRYRVQGEMFLERAGILNSADFGITYISLLGGTVDEEYQKNVNSRYPGKYGSFAIGIYNGPGYHDIEVNSNKTIEGRLSIRPIPEKMPGLQIHYNNIYGQGNLAKKNDFISNTAAVSYESKNVVLMVQYMQGTGNSSGSYTDSLFNSYYNAGYSAFAEFSIPKTKLKLFGRYDYHELDNESGIISNRGIFGLAYHFYKRNKIVVDCDIFDRNDLEETINFYEIALEINF